MSYKAILLAASAAFAICGSAIAQPMPATPAIPATPAVPATPGLPALPVSPATSAMPATPATPNPATGDMPSPPPASTTTDTSASAEGVATTAAAPTADTQASAATGASTNTSATARATPSTSTYLGAGLQVRDSAGAAVGRITHLTLQGNDTMATIRMGSHDITVPISTLHLDGRYAVSAQTKTELRALQAAPAAPAN